jgi:hypothetical protein
MSTRLSLPPKFFHAAIRSSNEDPGLSSGGSDAAPPVVAIPAADCAPPVAVSPSAGPAAADLETPEELSGLSRVAEDVGGPLGVRGSAARAVV